ncbi:MAG: hypothetical protein IJ189_06845 [Clostridia bacterium]|nr:hypothetical protein [Clostridia bacterium]
MKKLLCLLLTLALLPLLPARAETAIYESPYFTLSYDDALLTVEEHEDGVVLFLPRVAMGMTGIWCQVMPSVYPDWSEDGFLFADLEDDFDIAWPHACFIQPVDDGAYQLNTLCISAPDAFYYLNVSYPNGDPDGWGAALWEMLHTLDLPAQPAIAGSFRLDFFQGGAAGMRFTDVVVDAEAEWPLTLRPQGEVTGFVLEKIAWDADTFKPLSAQTLYAADRLSSGDNLNMYCFIPDVLPNLRIRCLNADGAEESWYISQSGRDGSLLLLSEQAVTGWLP